MHSKKYSYPSVNSIELSTTDTISLNTKSKTITKYKYPILVQAAEQCDDTVWKTIILDMANGKCPYKFSLRENKHSTVFELQFIHNSNGVTTCTKLPIYDITLLKEMIITFIKEHSYIKSEQDKIDNNKLVLEQIQQAILKEQDKLHVIKLSKISTFIDSLAIDTEHKKQLYTLICFNWQLKNLINSDFVFDNYGNIINILNIYYDNNNNKYYINPAKIKKNNNINKPIILHEHKPYFDTPNGVNMLQVWAQ